MKAVRKLAIIAVLGVLGLLGTACTVGHQDPPGYHQECTVTGSHSEQYVMYSIKIGKGIYMPIYGTRMVDDYSCKEVPNPTATPLG